MKSEGCGGRYEAKGVRRGNGELSIAKGGVMALEARGCRMEGAPFVLPDGSGLNRHNSGVPTRDEIPPTPLAKAGQGISYKR